jgi:hypothetical protein
MEARTRALQEIVATAKAYDLSATEITKALAETPVEGATRHSGVLVRVLGYLGGTFVFAGVGVFIALNWDSMNSAARVIITLGSGVAAFVLAVLSSREPRFDKATTPLFLMAAALEPTGMLVAFAEFGSGGDSRMAVLVTCATVAAQFGATFISVRRATVLFFTIFFGVACWWTAFDLLDVDGDATALVLGSSMVLVAIGVDRTMHSVITPPWYLVGSAAFLGGLFDLVEGSILEIAFLFAAAGFVYLSVAVHSRTLLFVATAALLAYTGWFTGQHFADSVGWPVALVIFGIAMIGLSAFAYRIDQRYLQESSSQRAQRPQSPEV